MLVKPKQTFRVGWLGFDVQEQQMLRTLLALSECRTPTFTAYVQGESDPHIVIVNADSPEAVANWRRYYQRPQQDTDVVPVYLTRCPRRTAPVYELGRPVVAAKLFALLEKVVTENHGFVAVAAVRPEDPLIVLTPNELSAEGGMQSCATLEQTARAGATIELRNVCDISALVIDDSLPVQMQMLAALHPMAAHIDFADSGRRALEFLETSAYSMVFLDVLLPDTDSYEVCRHIKHHPLHKNTPVIMLVGASTPADRVKGTEAGCNAYLIKPVRHAAFEQLVEQFVRTPGAI